MYDKAIEILKTFEHHGYLAYIVGGYPRDYLLGIKTNDIDICTNATPKEIITIFNPTDVSDSDYGSVVINYKGSKFDITTMRKDIKYENNRKPVKIKYISDLKTDLLRRDFTINTICIDSDGNYIDLMKAKPDIDKHIIKTVGNPRFKIKEDSLRILRAIRFAATLDFDIDIKTQNYIKKYGHLLKTLSGSRKRSELDKILTSKNKEKGRQLLISLGLDKHLEITNLKDIVLCDDIIGIWSQIDNINNFAFSKLELTSIDKIKKMLKEEINSYTIYKYGLYTSTVAGSIKNISYKEINNLYHSLPIYSKKDIVINAMDISTALKKKPGSYIKEIFEDLEYKIISSELPNERKKLLAYITKNY